MIAVNYFIPYYVNDVQSDIRGIKCGWYTMDECGSLGSGPFSTASECLGIDSQAKKVETPKWLHLPLRSPIDLARAVRRGGTPVVETSTLCRSEEPFADV